MTAMLNVKQMATGNMQTQGSHTLSILQQSDEFLISAIAVGDEQAMEILYLRYNRLLYTISNALVADHQVAEDLVQETFIAVWRHAPTYAVTAGSVRTWLSAIIRNRSIDYLRHRIVNTVAMSPELEGEESFALVDVWDEVWETVRNEEVAKALKKLPQRLRLLLVLAYYQDWSHSHIAKTCCIPPGTVKSRIRLGLNTLKPLLRDHVECEEDDSETRLNEVR